MRSGNVFSDGLFGKDVLSGCEGFFDVFWLIGNGETRCLLDCGRERGGLMWTYAIMTALISSRFSKSSKVLPSESSL